MDKWVTDNKGVGSWAFEKTPFTGGGGPWSFVVPTPLEKEGPFAFTKQPAVEGYINNPNWVETATAKHEPCGYWIGGGGGTPTPPVPCVSAAIVAIGYTSLSMSLGTTQQFTGLDSEGNPANIVACEWSVADKFTPGLEVGSITASGLYTAPATNAGCLKFPVVSLSCCGVFVDSIDLSVSNPWENFVAYVIGSGDCTFGGNCSGATCPPSATVGCGSWNFPWYCGVWKSRFSCTDVFYNTGSPEYCAVNYSAPYTGCTDKASGCVSCGNYNGVVASCAGLTDTRSAAMIAGGCCPSRLL